MRKIATYLAFLTLPVLLLLPPVFAIEPVAFESSSLTIHSHGKDHPFTIELAKTPAQQEYGLMFRTSLPADHGMLFLWDNDNVIQMWMKNTEIPLDMLFIDSKGHIIYIAQKAEPESLQIISAGKPVRAVMELAGGTAKTDHIAVGDTVIYPAFAKP